MDSFKGVLVYSKYGNYVTDLDDCFELADQYNRDLFRYITKLSIGNYVILYNSLYKDDEILAYEVSNKTALKTILESNRSEVLDKPKFADLKELYDKELVKEDNASKSYGSILVYNYGKLYAAVDANNLFDRAGYVGQSHVGLAKLTTGEYVITFSSECNSMNNMAYLVESKTILLNIINRGRQELLDDPKFKDLKELYDKKI